MRTTSVVVAAVTMIRCAASPPLPAIPPGPAEAPREIVVVGQVERPARVNATSARPLCALLDEAGGLTRLACGHVMITRTDHDVRRRWAIPLSRVRDRSACEVSISPGDELLVTVCEE
jgi:protein involved in polysaccharide export with SLBB domain